jgi:hypothetical protein
MNLVQEGCVCLLWKRRVHWRCKLGLSVLKSALNGGWLASRSGHFIAIPMCQEARWEPKSLSKLRKGRLLGSYAASCGNCLPTFRDKVSVPSSRVNSPKRKTPRNIREERRSKQHRGGSLKSKVSVLWRWEYS